LEGNMVIWWLSTNISTIYTLQIQAILSFNNQCLGSKEKKTKICARRVGKCFEVVHSKTSTNEQQGNIHMKAVRPPLLVCLSYAVLNLSTKSFIALQEDTNIRRKNRAFISNTCIQYRVKIMKWKCSNSLV
jgi:hypothetical protein